jgi:hypothetical protein
MQVVQTIYCSNHAEAMTLKLYVQGKLTKLQACIILRELTGNELGPTAVLLNMAMDNGFFDHNGSMITSEK